MRIVPEQLLRDLVTEVKAEEPVKAPASTSNGQSNGEYHHRLKVEQWLNRRGVPFRRKPSVDEKGRTIWQITCPIDSSHGSPDACIMQDREGKMSAICLHNGCQGKGWQDFKVAIGKPEGDDYDPPWVPPEKQKATQSSTSKNRQQQNGQTAPSPAEEPWSEPIPLDAVPPVTPFPLHVFPAWMADWARAEAEATQTPADLAAMLGLAVCAGGLAGKFRVRVREGWHEPTNLYVTVALEVGERKSAVFAEVFRPVQRYEKHLRAAAEEIVAAAASERRILEASLKTAEGSASKAKSEQERNKLTAEATKLARKLAAQRVPPMPQLYCDDITPEKLANRIAEQGGRMLLASPEGGVFEMIKGRYSDSPNFDVFLKAHAGDPLRTDRVSRAGESEDRPALTLALAVQPDVIRGLNSCACLRGRGMLARPLYSLPESRVGRRKIAPPPVPQHLAAQFDRHVQTLWALPGTVDENGEPAPNWITFEPAADQELRDFETWLEPKLAPGEDLSLLAGWANKLAGAAARIAGVLHVATAIGEGVRWQAPVMQQTAVAAVHLAREYLLPHAQAAFCVMGADELAQKASRVWELVSKRVKERCAREHESLEYHEYHPPRVTRRDIHQWARRQVQKAQDLEPILQLLTDHGYIRAETTDARSVRGQPSPVFLINPISLRAMAKGPPGTHGTHGTHAAGPERPAGAAEDDYPESWDW